MGRLKCHLHWEGAVCFTSEGAPPPMPAKLAVYPASTPRAAKPITKEIPQKTTRPRPGEGTLSVLIVEQPSEVQNR